MTSLSGLKYLVYTKYVEKMWQPDSLHPLSVLFFEGMMVRSTMFNDVEPSHRAKYKTMEKRVLFNTVQFMHSFPINSGGKCHVKI